MGGLITILTALTKAYIDFRRWPFENHWIGFVVVAVVMLSVCLIWWKVYPLFLYGLIFNPALNLMKGQPFFYVGDTAETDKTLKGIFGKWAGQAWFLLNLILLIITI